MSQDTITINCDVDGTTYTTNVNKAYSSIDSNHSAGTAPTTNIVEGKFWLDTSTPATPILKMRTADTWLAIVTYNGTTWIPNLVTNAVTTTIITDDAVTYAKIQNVVSDDVVLGRISGADGVVEELTGANVRTIANVEDGAEVNPTVTATTSTATPTGGAAGDWHVIY